MKPRGHSTLDWQGVLFFALLGVLFYVVPTASVGAIAIMSVLKIWLSYSWWWLMVPVGFLIAWAIVVRLLN